MTKIAYIGGGSIQWTPGLMADMAQTPELHGAELYLQDISVDALKRITPLCQEINNHFGSGISIHPSLEVAKALEGADFVIWCVGIGGLNAMRYDLEIPEKYGIFQSVGDTVGPGGLSRGLRHIPFAVELAQAMETYCPDAWLLNLTNPMTTICRAITKATSIKTIGLCHEVTHVHTFLAGLLDVSKEELLIEIGGINHLPVITKCIVNGRDGFELLREWLSNHNPFEFVNDGELSNVFQVFYDQHAVKLTQFLKTGVFYTAGDRHIIEFFSNFLTDKTGYGRQYGVHLTTVEHREGMAAQRVKSLEDYAQPNEKSSEQLTDIMAAFLGGPSGEFIVNITNSGQIDNLPREAVVECTATIDELGVHPHAIGPLPLAAHAILASHVDRQELIVEAILSGKGELARAALATDPLIQDPETVDAMFDDLFDANQKTIAKARSFIDAIDLEKGEMDLSDFSVQTPMKERSLRMTKPDAFSVEATPLKTLLENPETRAILEKYFADQLDHPQIHLALGFSLNEVASYAPFIFTRKKLERIAEDFNKLDV